MTAFVMLLMGFVWYQIIAMFGLSIGLHRHFAHNQFKTSKLFESISLFLAMLAFSRSPLSWIGAHRIHHRFSDTEKDPHSPTHKGFWNVLFNNWQVKKIDRPYVRDLYKNPRIMFFHNHWLKIHIATAVITLLIPLFVIRCNCTFSYGECKRYLYFGYISNFYRNLRKWVAYALNSLFISYLQKK